MKKLLVVFLSFILVSCNRYPKEQVKGILLQKEIVGESTNLYFYIPLKDEYTNFDVSNYDLDAIIVNLNRLKRGDTVVLFRYVNNQFNFPFEVYNITGGWHYIKNLKDTANLFKQQQ